MKPFGIALLMCVVSAALEGVFAGKGAKTRLSELRLPSFSPPQWMWYAIGLAYYIICFTVLYRILAQPSSDVWTGLALFLMLAIMAINAGWNWIFFRRKNLRASFLSMLPYDVLAVALLICLLQIDRVSAAVFGLYAAYLCYANVWTYRIWQLNRSAG